VVKAQFPELRLKHFMGFPMSKELKEGKLTYRAI